MAQKPTPLIKKAVPAIKKAGLLSKLTGEKDTVLLQMNPREAGPVIGLLQSMGGAAVKNPRTGILSFPPAGGQASHDHDAAGGMGGSSRGGGGGNPGGNGPGNGGNANGTGSDSGGVGAGTSTSGKGTAGTDKTGPLASPVGLGSAIGGMFGGQVGPMSRGLSPDPTGAVDDRGFLDRAKSFFSGFADINRAPTEDPAFNGFLDGIGVAVPGFNTAMGLTRGLQDATGSMGTPGVANDHANAGMGGPTTDVNQAQQQAALAASTGQTGNIPTSIPSLGLLGQYSQPYQQWTTPGYGFQVPGQGYLQWGQQ